MKTNPTTNNAIIEEFTKHPREYHNSGNDFIRGKSTCDVALEGLTAINGKLDTVDRSIKKIT